MVWWPNSSPRPKQPRTHQHIELGLKILTATSSDGDQPDDKQRLSHRSYIVNSNSLGSVPLPPPPSSSSSISSCGVDDKEEEGEGEGEGEQEEEEMMMKTRRKREFSPPIPLLMRTAENLPSRRPWTLKKTYKRDGRLIIQLERVKRQEFLQVHRADGCLTLKLIEIVYGSPHRDPPDDFKEKRVETGREEEEQKPVEDDGDHKNVDEQVVVIAEGRFNNGRTGVASFDAGVVSGGL